ncbi:MAG: DUF4365 domain-containing protein [Planctomycetes bacterium]|nr:DUF4365 domain-containing protein [Planctomycetota bacterium]
MTDEHRMEQLSRAYVHAVAAMCGCTCAKPDPDYGVDLSLRRVVERRQGYREIGKSLYLQLKSTRIDTRDSEHVVYDLDARAYDILRRSTRDSPSLLVLLILPSTQENWLDQNEERLELRHCAYWYSLRGLPSVENVSTVRIRIPRQNQFNTAQLLQIMERIQRNEDLS